MHKVELAVRSYECDVQGIVNNAVYLNYLEYARHALLKKCGINFIQLHERGKDLVVTRAELDYKFSLKSDDEFYILTSFHKISKLRWTFHQDIYRRDDKHVLHAEITGTCINPHSKPIICEELNKLIN